MKKEIIKNERLKEQYYKINHPSGLEILVWEMKEFSSTMALFGTKYGSVNTTFKTKNEDDFVTVPEGIAHFLEHKLFENEDCNVFSLYAKTGANGNAYTSFDKTCYLFSCSENYDKSLEILLDFVQKPYFTQETVDKEQGIIGQEIQMYQDNAGWIVFFNLLRALYEKNPVRIDIAGTIDSIAQIDAPLLYRCYNTFYNLHNMCLSIAGNVDVDEVLKICDKMLKKNENIELETKFPEESEAVFEKEILANLPVGLPLFQIGYKVKPAFGKELVKRETICSILLSLIAGSTSPLYKEMTEKGLINSTFSSDVFSGEGYFAIILEGESKEPKKVRDMIFSEVERLKKVGLDKERFEIIKKTKFGGLVRSYNNSENCAMAMLNSKMLGVDAFASVDVLAEVTFEDVTNALNEYLDSEKSAISIVES